jgi:predicted RNA-binding protein YlqC (UPF0109 family)
VSRAREVAEVVARALVDVPEAVEVTETLDRGVTLVELTVDPGDIGRVIGRQGRTIDALRTLVELTGEFHDFEATLEVREPA